jgi:hypothetical protein
MPALRSDVRTERQLRRHIPPFPRPSFLPFDSYLELFQNPDRYHGRRWLRKRNPLSLRHMFYPRNDNSEFPSLYIKKGFINRFTFLIPFKMPSVRVMSLRTAVREPHSAVTVIVD